MVARAVPELVTDALVDAGVRDVFCVVGGAITPLVAHLVRDGRLRMHYMYFEQSAGIAAEAYGFAHGVPACLLVTSGPGATNALTPVAAAWTNSTPLIVISGQVRTLDIESAGGNRQWGSQHLHVEPMASGIVKEFYSARLRDVGTRVREVFTSACAPRTGPVWLELPLDVQRQTAECAVPLTEQPEVDAASAAAVDWNAILEGVERPLFLFGNGVRGCERDAIALARRLNWPVQLTWPALDFLQCDDPLYAGRPGSISTWAANLTLQSADLVVIVGARLDWGQIAFNPTAFCANAKVVRVDVDPDELRRIPERGGWLNIEGQAIPFLESMRVAAEVSWPITAEWRRHVRSWQTSLSSFGDGGETTTGISMYELLEEIQSGSGGFRTVVTGSSGTCAEQTMQAICPAEGQRILNSGGLGSMGFPVAGAIGAFYATGGAVLCLESDGSFWMNPQDLAYIASHRLPITCVFLDSNGYKSLRLSHERGGYEVAGSDIASGLALPSIRDFAVGLGLPTRVLTQSDDWRRALRESLNADAGPQVIVVMVDQQEEALPRTVSRIDANGQMVTATLQDLWPPLSDDEREAHWPTAYLG